MAKASSDIGPTEAAAVSAMVSTIVTAATASVSAVVRGVAPASSAPTSVAATGAPHLSPPTSAAAAGRGIEPINRTSEGSVIDDAAVVGGDLLENAQPEDNAAGAGRNRRLNPLVPKDSEHVIKNEEEKGGRPRGAAQVVYSRGPEDGEVVWVAGRREPAAVKVVEQRHPFYQLNVMVKVTLHSSLAEQEAHAGSGLPHPPEGTNTAEVVQVSTSFRKSDIKEALASWITSSVFNDTASPPEEMENNKNNQYMIVVDASMRRWVSTGRAPRSLHLVQWLLRRLELVEVAATGYAESASVQGWRGEKCWSLAISAAEFDAERGPAGDETRDDLGRRTRGENELEPVRRAGGGGGLTLHRIPFGSTTQPRGRKGAEGGGDLWWNHEDPWETGSRSATSASDENKPALQPPGYTGIAPPPPYEEAICRSSHANKSVRKKTAAETAAAAAAATRRALLHPFVSDDASESGTLGPPPSYHTTSGRDSIFSEEEDEGAEEDEDTAALPRTNNVDETAYAMDGGGRATRKQQRRRTEPISRSVYPIDAPEDLPLPLHGKYYDTVSSNPTTAPSHRRSRTMPDSAGWDRDQRYRERERERERGRRRRRVVGSGATFSLDAAGPETAQEPLELTSGWRSGRASSAPRGVGRARTLPGKGTEQRGATWVSSFGNSEGWEDDRLRLTGYLEDCRRKLVEAEERRRRAEAEAAAAEHSAWKNASHSKHGADDAAKRAWAKAATQRVLDLTLVTERVRQEERKGRVAAARANNKVAHSKQPFRERRGRSRKGPWIGPSVHPTDVSEPQRDPRIETALRSFYWDEHGRRYNRGETAPGHRRSGELDVAMETVRKMAAAHLVGGMDFIQSFRDLDADGDGRLSLPELGTALRRAGVRLSLSQVTALFRHFDEGVGLDTIGRRRLLWEFVDTRSLLDQWRNAGDAKGGHRARVAIFRDRANLADSGGTLSRRNFSRALEELDIRVHGWEEDALLDRFEVDEDENIDWRGFVSFMQGAENEESEHSHGVHNKANTATSSDEAAAQGLPYDSPHRGISWREHAAERGDRNPRIRGGGAGGGDRHAGKGGWNDGISGSTNTNNNTSSGNRNNTKTKHREFHTLRRRREDAGLPRTGATTTAHRGGLFERGNVLSYPTISRATTAEPGNDTRAVTAATGSSMPGRQRPSSSRAPERALGPWESDPRGWRGGATGVTAGAGGRRGEGSVSTAQASKLIDELLEDQQELEEFLEEELAKRRGLGDGEEPGQRVETRRRSGD